MVETAAPGACDIGEDAVEDERAAFVGVEARIERVAFADRV